jgi:LSM domain
MEGVIIGFDEYMNIVLDDAIEINTNSKQQQQKRINVGRCLLKGDAITLIQLRTYILLRKMSLSFRYHHSRRILSLFLKLYSFVHSISIFSYF